MVIGIFLDQHLFTLDEFNSELKTFNFGYSDSKCKPEPLKKSVFVTGERKLKYSAGNAKVFIKILPFILSRFVDKDDPFYIFIVELLEIVQIAYSPVISEGTCGYLTDLIKNHLEQFKSLFPDHNIIPKHHYLVELPVLIRMFGPPVRYCCMRFEALHKVFKSFVPYVSFKTLCKSLADKFLKSTYFDVATEESYEHPIFDSVRVDGPGHVLRSSQVQSYRHRFPRMPVWDAPFIYELKWVACYGVKYLINECVVAVTADEETHLPVFGKLLKVILSGDTVCFIVEEICTMCFDASYCAYSVQETDRERAVLVSTLLDFNVYQNVSTLEGDIMVPIKYDLSDLIEEHIAGKNPLHQNIW